MRFYGCIWGSYMAANRPEMVLRFADNFDTSAEPWGPLTVYRDNTRLADPYASGAKPVTYTLQPCTATG